MITEKMRLKTYINVFYYCDKGCLCTGGKISIFLNSQVPKFYWFLVFVYEILNSGIEDIIKR